MGFYVALLQSVTIPRYRICVFTTFALRGLFHVGDFRINDRRRSVVARQQERNDFVAGYLRRIDSEFHRRYTGIRAAVIRAVACADYAVFAAGYDKLDFNLRVFRTKSATR